MRATGKFNSFKFKYTALPANYWFFFLWRSYILTKHLISIDKWHTLPTVLLDVPETVTWAWSPNICCTPTTQQNKIYEFSHTVLLGHFMGHRGDTAVLKEHTLSLHQQSLLCEVVDRRSSFTLGWGYKGINRVPQKTGVPSPSVPQWNEISQNRN